MFGENLKRLRAQHGYSQEELGAKLIVNDKPVSGKTIWSWESGRTEPSMGVIQQLADLFGVVTDELIQEDGKKPNIVPDFKTAQEAVAFLLRLPLVADFGGYDLDNMSDEEIINFAHEIAGMIQFAAQKKQDRKE